MKNRGRLWAMALGLAAVCAAGGAGAGVEMRLAGGTLPGVKPDIEVRMDFTGPDKLRLVIGESEYLIPYLKVDSLEYGQNVSRRFTAAILISPMLLLSKTRKHYVTLGYVDEKEAQQALVFRVDKRDIRGVLAGLEARTGRRVEYQDNEARKAAR